MEYKVIRSNRKTLVLTINDMNDIIVKAPYNITDQHIESFVNKHIKWINKKIEINKNRSICNVNELNKSQIDELKSKTLNTVLPKIEHYSKIMGLKYNKITITSANKRFGSCNTKKNICFSYRLSLYPDDCIDYIVVHELSHLKYMNHSKKFYSLIEKYIPNYIEIENKLKVL